MLGIARLEVSAIVDVPEHVAGDGTVGAATEISGLKPGALAPDGTVASLKSGVATVLEAGDIGAALPTKELVSVESVLLAREAASVVVVVGLHRPEIVDVPNAEVIGSAATGGVEVTEGLEATEGDDEDINGPVVTVAVLAAVVVEPVAAVAGHIVMPPSEIPVFGPKLPR